MPTPSIDTKAQSETLEQIAERIARGHFNKNSGREAQFCRLYADVLSVLRNERERAAKIAEDILPIGSDDCYWCERVQRAAWTIREGR